MLIVSQPPPPPAPSGGPGFYDDFNGGALSTEWDASGNPETPYVSGGQLHIEPDCNVRLAGAPIPLTGRTLTLCMSGGGGAYSSIGYGLLLQNDFDYDGFQELTVDDDVEFGQLVWTDWDSPALPWWWRAVYDDTNASPYGVDFYGSTDGTTWTLLTHRDMELPAPPAFASLAHRGDGGTFTVDSISIE
ncbi:hypothetical protein [Gordonia sp. (in: high G+C Gram-positive bacteria)]|uniref:hypothetical protein n=1 Tax=Gordonia sp. (in: high G+C Gram-positive bacteria) TaxID=84139 RepID=UPI0039E2CD8C